MERSLVVFVLVVLVAMVALGAATPHGYGVKGGAGAAAKAEASAVAGAFGGLGPLPLSIPSGSGYSGSFSKSSSSSFASSSASASSSSFSFSGSGANGIAGVGSDKGCSSGTCNGAGANDANGNHHVTGANAVSAAQAKALSGSYTPCQGTSCNGAPSDKCTTGQCSPDSAAKGQNGCAGGGDCQSPSSGSKSDSEDNGQYNKEDGDSNDSNDFAVNINRDQQSKFPHDANGQPSYKDKSYNPEPPCSNGKCGPGNSGQTNYGSNQNKPPVPSTYLTAPNTNPPCTTPDCHYSSPSGGPQTSGLPSSYNVPIQSATNPPNTYHSSPVEYGSAPNQQKGVTSGVPCTSPTCNSPAYNGASNIPNYNQPENQGHSNYKPCTSGQCGVPSSFNEKANSGTGSGVPSYSQGSIPSNYQPGYQGHSNHKPCTSGQCGGPTSSNGKANSDSGSGIPNYSQGTIPSNYQPENEGHTNHKQCTSGQCFVPLSSNGKANSGVGSGVPNYPHGSIPSNIPSGQPGQPGCTAPYCSGLPTYTSLPSNQAGNACSGTACGGVSPTTSHTKSDSDAPVYTGGFGGPPGFLDINSGYNKGSGNSGLGYNHNTPSGSRPSGPHGSNPTPVSFGTTNSNNIYGSTHSSKNGGSTGVFDHNKPSSIPTATGSQFNPSTAGNYGAPTASSPLPLSSYSHPQQYGDNKPTTSHFGSIGLSQTNSGSNSIQGSFGITKPNVAGDNLSSPPYTGGFGGPTETGSAGGSKPGSSNCGSVSCNGQLGANVNDGTNDKTNPSSSQYKPAYTGGFGGPAGILSSNNVNMPSNSPTAAGTTPCVNGNCDSKGSPSSSQASGHNLATASASANAVVYSGGFGGPPGFLKPYDDGKANGQGLNGNLANGHSPSSNNGHPNTPSVNGKSSEPGSHANGANAGANAAAHASATASATAGSYGGSNNNGSSRGCNGGCSPNGGGGDGSEIPDGLTKSGFGVGALASAKSSAAAFGNIASSSASAHASAGAATKGGYGRK